ncbi:integrase/recombinase xerD homolog [Lissotriton helveticus]
MATSRRSDDGIPGKPVEAWCPIASDLIAASVAPKTKSRYERAWQVYMAVLQSQGGAGEFTPLGVLRFKVSQREEGRSLTLVRRQLSAIAFFAGIKGVADPTKDLRVRRAMRGWERLAPRVKDTRRPIDSKRLVDILGVLPQVCWSHYEMQLLRLAYSLAFFGAFRISELVPSTKMDKQGGMSVEDVVVAAELLQVRVRRSKTDPLGKGVWVQLRAVQGAGYCPVMLMGRFLQIRPRCDDDRLLVHADGTPLTRFQFTRICKRALELLGEDVAHFTSHSFRIGAATTAAELGLSSSAIKKMGRWSSSCFERYVRPQLV